MSNEKNVADKADPSVLGVSVPLSITKEKAAELYTVWRDCAVGIFSAAKGRVAPSRKEESKAQMSVSSQTPVASA